MSVSSINLEPRRPLGERIVVVEIQAPRKDFKALFSLEMKINFRIVLLEIIEFEGFYTALK